ncbi:MAG: hypothetical protein ABI568_12505, partial [Pseudarthrobacter sp.]
MIGARARLLAWLVALATLLGACASAVRLDAIATDQPTAAISSAPPAAGEITAAPQPTSVPVPTAAQNATPAPVPTP